MARLAWSKAESNREAEDSGEAMKGRQRRRRRRGTERQWAKGNGDTMEGGGSGETTVEAMRNDEAMAREVVQRRGGG